MTARNPEWETRAFKDVIKMALFCIVKKYNKEITIPNPKSIMMERRI